MRTSASIRPHLLLLIPALLAIGLLLYATLPYGLGVSRDSVSYLNAAQNLYYHQSFATNFSTDSLEPVSHWPIFYPAVLSLFYAFGDDIVHSALVLNALLIALYIIAIEILVLQATYGAKWIAFGAGLFAAFSYTTLYVFSRMWSETLFIFLFLYGMILLVRYFGQPRMSMLLASSVLFALAWLTRYVGVTLIATGFIAILLWSGRTWQLRVRDLVIMAIIGSAPVAVLVVRNYLLTSSGANRSIGFHPVDREWWMDGVSTIGAWLVPASFQYEIKLLGAAVVAVVFLAGTVLTIVEAHKNGVSRKRSEQLWIVPAMFLIFTSTYLTIIVLSRVLFDPAIPSDGRLLLPAFTSLTVIAAFVANYLVSTNIGRKQILRIAFIIFVALLFALQLTRAAKWSHAAHENGLHYNTKAYQNSPVIQHISNLPDSSQLYSNNPQLVYFLSGNQTRSIAQINCDETCTETRAEFDHLGTSLSQENTLVWVPVYDRYRCESCFLELATEYGFNITAQDNDFWLFQETELD